MSLETTEKVVCIGCGQAVALRDGSFCSNACRKRELRARHRHARVQVCVGCGKAFNNRRRDAGQLSPSVGGQSCRGRAGP